MRLTVVHNPDAGDDSLTRDELCTLLQRAGHRPDYHSTDEKGWKDALDDPAELVVAVGGDGTIAKVARRLAGRGTAMAVLPAGTSNNIARTLGLCRDARTLVDEWTRARLTPLDLGMVEGPMGERLFVEGLGLGLFPRLMQQGERTIDTDGTPGREQITRALDLVRELADTAPPMRCCVTVDGLALTGDYLAVEVMNIRSIGPRVELASEADPHDGLLDLVIVRDSEREALRALVAAHGHDPEVAAALTRMRTHQVELSWDGRPVHIDADIWPEPDDDDVHGADAHPEPSTMRIQVLPGAVEILC